MWVIPFARSASTPMYQLGRDSEDPIMNFIVQILTINLRVHLIKAMSTHHFGKIGSLTFGNEIEDMKEWACQQDEAKRSLRKIGYSLFHDSNWHFVSVKYGRIHWRLILAHPRTVV